MSKYTTEVRYICETNASLSESEGYNSVDTIIAESRAKIFDFDYPIFDETYKPTLETKILRHYYTREIGVETVGLWKHFLNMRMNEIMPYYNKLYESELIEFNPLYDVDYTKEGTHSDNEDRTDNDSRTDTMTGTVADVGTSSDAMTGTVGDAGTTSETMTGTVSDAEGGTQGRSGSNVPKKSTWDLYSDTPQGGIAGIQGADPSLGSNAYLTNARHIIEDGTGSTDSETITFGKTNTKTYNTNNAGTSGNTRTYNTNNAGTNNNTRTYNTENESEGSRAGNTAREGEYFERIKGKIGGRSYAKMLQELRETFLNIDMMIIEDLSDLFLNIY